MRLVAGLLALTLTGTLAFADEAKAPEPQPSRVDRARTKVGLRVVRVMTESHQALLFDKNRGTHVLADVGSVIGAYVVTAIEEDEVTLTSDGREVVLAAPEPTEPRPIARKPAVAPADPYPSLAPPIPGGPDDPYAPDDAPIAPGQGGVRVASAPSSAPMTNPYDAATLDAANTATAPITSTEMEVNPYNEPELAPADSATDPYAEPTPTPAPAPAKPLKKGAVDDEGARAFADAMNGHVIVKGPDDAPVAAPAAPAADPATLVSRTELNAALGDFAGLTASMRGAFTPAGARIDVVAPGTVFAKAGLRNGDVVTSVDGLPLKSIDDAADLYIRAGSARTATVQLLRAGKPMTLRLTIQ